MDEHKKYSLLPRTDSTSGNPGVIDPPLYSASDPTDYMAALAQQEVATRRRRRLRIGLFKLCLVGMVVYTLLWPTTDPEDGEKRPWGRPHHVNRRPKNMPPFSFEKHMKGDVEQIIAGSLESKYVSPFMSVRSCPLFLASTIDRKKTNPLNTTTIYPRTIVIALSGIVWLR